MNSIKWDYWQNVGAARDEYTRAKLALRSMSKRSNGYSHQLEHVDDLRNKFINRSVSFICRESRAERPRMWSAFYLSMLDLDKINQDDSHDYTNYLVMEYLVRALGWDSTPIGDNNNLFTCDDFHKYIKLDSCLDVERPSVAGLWAIVKMLEEMGGVAAHNAETISLHYIVDAAAKKRRRQAHMGIPTTIRELRCRGSGHRGAYSLRTRPGTKPTGAPRARAPPGTSRYRNRPVSRH